MKLSVLAASLALAAFPAFAESVRVVDGDTLKIDGVTYRLWGIDAPESGQLCADGWPAGRAATEHLRALIRNRQVSCEARTLDRYGRTVAICRADGRDLGADMVSDGLAWAFVRYSREYVEENAKLRRSGPACMVAPANPRGVALRAAISLTMPSDASVCTAAP
jgi:endonuclease YncB( thermonuclease family)